MPKRKRQEGDFRIRGKKLSVTWAQCPVGKPAIRAHISRTLQHVKTVALAEEVHADSGLHIHAEIVLHKTLETMNPRILDFKDTDNEVYHPNIQLTKFDASWRAYLMKEDPEFIDEMQFDDASPINFMRRMADFEAWKAHHQKKARVLSTKVFSIKLPDGWYAEDGTIGPTHAFTGREGGGMVLIGPSGIRKTTMILGNVKHGEEGLLKDHSVYTARGDKPECHFESYADEEFIVYDDVLPKRAHLIHLLQDQNQKEKTLKVPGEKRFHPAMMSGMQQRQVIVILNESEEKLYPDWKSQGLDTRMRVYRWRKVAVPVA